MLPAGAMSYAELLAALALLEEGGLAAVEEAAPAIAAALARAGALWPDWQ